MTTLVKTPTHNTFGWIIRRHLPYNGIEFFRGFIDKDSWSSYHFDAVVYYDKNVLDRHIERLEKEGHEYQVVELLGRDV